MRSPSRTRAYCTIVAPLGAFLTLIVAAAHLEAQGDPPTPGWGSHVVVGLGGGFGAAAGDARGLTLRAGFSVGTSPHAVTLRGVTIGGLFNDHVAEAAILYKRLRPRTAVYRAVSAGLSAVRVEESGPGWFETQRKATTVGIPVEVEVGAIRGGFGIGAVLVGNLNSEASFLGVVVHLLGGRP